MGDDRRALFHAARNALNGLVLQLEVAALNAERGEIAMVQRSIDQARRAAAELTDTLDALDDEGVG